MAKKDKEESKQARQVHYQCAKCGSDFWGSKTSPECPICGEKTDVLPLNEDGVPLSVAKRATGSEEPLEEIYSGERVVWGGNGAKLEIDVSREAVERARRLAEENYSDILTETVRDMYLERAKAKLLEHKAQRIEAEKRLKKALGEEDEEEKKTQQQADSLGMSIFFSSLANLPDDKREALLDRLERSPQLVFALQSIFNPSA
ncbi:MAG: TFIIB-type zinc ribbon-containing protein, partial [Candidatus Methanospirareceae archaeon]